MDVDDVLVLFVFSVFIVVVGISFLGTHRFPTHACIVIDSLLGPAPFAPCVYVLCVVLSMHCLPLLTLELLDVLGGNALVAAGRRPLLTA